MSNASYSALEASLKDRGIAINDVRAAVRALKIETPSWGYANSGTRFHTFKYPGAAGSIFEKLDDAAPGQQAHRRLPDCCRAHPLG